jgi:hypothetical protein
MYIIKRQLHVNNKCVSSELMCNMGFLSVKTAKKTIYHYLFGESAVVFPLIYSGKIFSQKDRENNALDLISKMSHNNIGNDNKEVHILELNTKKDDTLFAEIITIEKLMIAVESENIETRVMTLEEKEELFKENK